MAKYTYNCADGHDEPDIMEVEADNDDTAKEMMMEKVKAHLAEHHSEMGEMSDEDLKTKIEEGWEKTE